MTLFEKYEQNFAKVMEECLRKGLIIMKQKQTVNDMLYKTKHYGSFDGYRAANHIYVKRLEKRYPNLFKKLEKRGHVTKHSGGFLSLTDKNNPYLDLFDFHVLGYDLNYLACKLNMNPKRYEEYQKHDGVFLGAKFNRI